ncbi:iron-containing alcohol dehydrogenase [Heyndrickxia acidicola]|uniref:Iron-containing alcohol dehydrogenase n=1 Tax=Heyndrickxia acidicola TaxID=209389 RepID=A0ABU6ME90_9BACI|nr:iron-containing alcohol dehydrogenase [Heyndrickxia acidicola]MED1202619.1 iron-containing alcohol dehydrogenase [Heyndrickxia acidicola]
MMSYSYFCNTRIEMGMGKSLELPIFLRSISTGSSLLLVSDPGVVKAGLVKPVQESLEKSGYRVVLFDRLSQNPRDTECLEGAKLYRGQKMEAVVAIGGGSAMDTGKAIALLGPNGGTPIEYIEGKRPYANIAPIICVPTTAGTGSEVTRSSVITEAATHRKLTLKDAALRPALAVLDPQLTFSVPQSVTAATGVDALVHAIEGSTCKITNPISQALGARAMKIIVSTLPKAVGNGRKEKARCDMLEASLLAGMCFGSSDVAAVHCLAEALGGLYDTPHGVANAVFLPHVLKFNAETEKTVHVDLARQMGFARENDSDQEAVEKLVSGILEFTKGLGIPRLKDLPGVRKEDFPRIAELAAENNSTPSNVRDITKEDYLHILNYSYEGNNALLESIEKV